ncbi:MAG: aspartate-semialdehyde dehydrogenase [Planctomycetota bacterium JB042]
MIRREKNEPKASPAEAASVAVLGATGLVGEEMIRRLERRGFPVGRLLPLASRRDGRSVRFAGEAIPVEKATPERLAGVDLVLSSAGGAVSRALLPAAAASGAICIDNTSAFRLRPDVPLVVPEVNGHRLEGLRIGEKGAIVANPNCSTIQLVLAVAPLHGRAAVRRIVVSTYQSISGAGARAVGAFRDASRSVLDDASAESGGPAVFDVLPDIGGVDANGDSVEEKKMILETPKILEAEVAVDATCVRVPVVRGHAESVWVETAEPLSTEEAREVLSRAPGVRLAEGGGGVVTPRGVERTDPVHVGRIRGSRTAGRGLQLWVVADNLLKGAALNAVQIAERIVGVAAAGRASDAVAAGTGA